MKQITRPLALALAFIFAAPAFATNQWTSALTVSSVQATPAGGFVVYLTGWSDPVCNTNSTGIYFYSGNNGMTADGVKASLAVALTALTSGKTVLVLYDDSGATGPAGLCWGTNIEVNQ